MYAPFAIFSVAGPVLCAPLVRAVASPLFSSVRARIALPRSDGQMSARHDSTLVSRWVSGWRVEVCASP